jgi:hypothetical protein
LAATIAVVFAVGLAGCKSKPVEEKAAPPTEPTVEKVELPPAPADFPELKIPEDNPQTPASDSRKDRAGSPALLRRAPERRRLTFLLFMSPERKRQRWGDTARRRREGAAADAA